MRRLVPERIDNVIGNCYPVILMARMDERIDECMDGWHKKVVQAKEVHKRQPDLEGLTTSPLDL